MPERTNLSITDSRSNRPDRDDENDASNPMSEPGSTLQLSPMANIAISSLLPADSPRVAGEDREHVRALAESDVTLPPIVVHRSTMRVVDGMHRLRAAILRGQRDIAVLFYDGDSEDAFVLAVSANIAHGLPLSLTDRSMAAGRIVRSRPEWSDRRIAAVTGLSPKTVGAIRRRSTEGVSQLNGRVGNDGKIRPLNSSEGRRIAGELMAANPQASLRAVAKASGISPSTTRDVRERLRRGEEPELSKRPRVKSRSGAGKTDSVTGGRWQPDRESILSNLRRDPSLRFNEAGRTLLRLLDANTIEPHEWSRLIDSVPTHCASMIADAADECAETWRRVATQFKRRGSVSA